MVPKELVPTGIPIPTKYRNVSKNTANLLLSVFFVFLQVHLTDNETDYGRLAGDILSQKAEKS